MDDMITKGGKRNGRCTAFKQSQDYPESFMPCTGAVDCYELCKEHALAQMEILLGEWERRKDEVATEARRQT